MQVALLGVFLGEVREGAECLVVFLVLVERERTGRAAGRGRIERDHVLGVQSQGGGRQQARRDHGSRGRRPADRHGPRAGRHPADGGGRTVAAAFAGQSCQREEKQSCAQRPLVTLDGPAVRLGVDLARAQFAQTVLDDRPHDRLAVREPKIKPVARPGNLGQPGFVEPGADDLTVLVAHEFPSPSARQRDERALGAAEADREDPHPGGGGALGGQESVGLFGVAGGFAVAQEKDGAVARAPFAECVERQVDGSADVRAAERDEVHVEFVGGAEHGVVVDGQRSLEEGVARKGHEADTVTREQTDEVLHGEFRAGEAVGREVGGEHALGNVDDHDEIESTPVDFEGLESQTRRGHGDEEKRHSGQEQAVAPTTAGSARGSGQLRAQSRIADELHEPGGRAAFRPHEQPRQHGQRQQSPQP